MGPFHRHVHQWHDIGDYEWHPPASVPAPARRFGLHGVTALQESLIGFTVFHQRCACGNVVARRVAGRYCPTRATVLHIVPRHHDDLAFAPNPPTPQP